MIALVLLFILAWHFYIGYARGFVLQLYYSLSTLVAFVVASFYYKSLADALTLWVPYSSPTEDAPMFFFESVNIFELDRVFYAGVAFIIIYTAVYLLLRFVGLFMHFVDIKRFDNKVYQVISGVLSVLVTVTFASMVVTVLATIPMALVQNALGNNLVFRFLFNFPILSQILHWLWVTSVL